MKYLLIIGFLILNSGVNLNAQTKSDAIKPKIKTVKLVSYLPKNGQLKSRKNLFDSNISTYTVYDKNEKVIVKEEYERDGSIAIKTTYERNDEGAIIKSIRTSSKSTSSFYKYDSNDNLIEIRTYDSDNNLTNIQSNKYDKFGNKIEKQNTGPGNVRGQKFIYKYNSDNKKVEDLWYFSDGNLLRRRTYSYDKNGNENLQFKFKPDGSFKKIVSEYDEMNNIIFQNWFNEKNEKTYQVSFDYVYDKNGNWITKKRIPNGKIRWVQERQIEYYK